MVNVKVNSDGTKSGTHLWVDDIEIMNLVEMSFSCYSYDSKPYFTYTTESLVDSNSEMVKRETYFLADKYTMDRLANPNKSIYVGQAKFNEKEYQIFKIVEVIKKDSKKSS